MRDKLERPPTTDLRLYMNLVEGDYASEISLKESSYEWLLTTGGELAALTTGKEKKELLKVMDEIQFKWKTLKETLKSKKCKGNALLQVINFVARFSDL